MPKRIFYEFDGFVLDTVRRTLLLNGEPRPLASRGFDLLRALVESRERTVSKTELIDQVWKVPSVTDNTFNVTLSNVRRALGESGRVPQYVIRMPEGYRFVADVREVRSVAVPSTEEGQSPHGEPIQDNRRPEEGEARNTAVDFPRWSQTLTSYRWHIFLASTLYALMYTDALLLEIAYKWDTYGSAALKLSPAIFTWILISSVVALMLCRRWANLGNSTSLVFTVAIFVTAAALLYCALIFFLPSTAVTEAWFQASTGQAAYLKNICFYFLPLAIVFLLIPFHSISVLDREVRRGNCCIVMKILPTPAQSTSFGLFIPSRALGWILFVAAIVSLLLTYRLFDNLKDGPYQNLFSILAILRVMLYFGFGAECLAWYHMSLEGIRTVCETQLKVIDAPS